MKVFFYVEREFKLKIEQSQWSVGSVGKSWGSLLFLKLHKDSFLFERNYWNCIEIYLDNNQLVRNAFDEVISSSSGKIVGEDRFYEQKKWNNDLKSMTMAFNFDFVGMQFSVNLKKITFIRLFLFCMHTERNQKQNRS